MTSLTTLAKHAKQVLYGEWRLTQANGAPTYRHSWTNGDQTITIRQTTGASGTTGYTVELETTPKLSPTKLTHPPATSFTRALILADLHMRSDREDPPGMIKTRSHEPNPNQHVLHKDWLDTHQDAYTFQIIDPDSITRP